MKRDEVKRQYRVDENGVIRSPGKFEGEMLYVPHFWEAYLDGMADDDDGTWMKFNVDEGDRREYPELQGVRTVKLRTDDSGFVHSQVIGAPKPRVIKLAGMLDAVADSLEAKGLVKEAAEVDAVADTIEQRLKQLSRPLLRKEFHRKRNEAFEERARQEEERAGRARWESEKNTYKENAWKGAEKLATMLDVVADSLESKGLVREAAEVDAVSNTIEAAAAKWFDEQGNLIRDIPKEAVSACSGPGRADEAVESWRKKLNFEVPRAKAISYLREYGAWDAPELQAMDDDDLAEKVLWIACGDIKERGEWIGLTH